MPCTSHRDQPVPARRPCPRRPQGSGGSYEALIDVPSKVFDVDFVGQLRAMGAVKSLRHVVITRLTPERVPVLAAVLSACQQRGVQLLLTNPALRLLEERRETDEALAQALKGVQLEPVSRSSSLKLSARGQVDGRRLRFIPIPTPRWPDLVAVHSEEDGILFSSNFFSAHTSDVGGAPVGGRRSAADLGGWERYGADWQYYYDCMMTPVARQVASEWPAGWGMAGAWLCCYRGWAPPGLLLLLLGACATAPPAVPRHTRASHPFLFLPRQPPWTASTSASSRTAARRCRPSCSRCGAWRR